MQPSTVHWATRILEEIFPSKRGVTEIFMTERLISGRDDEADLEARNNNKTAFLMLMSRSGHELFIH